MSIYHGELINKVFDAIAKLQGVYAKSFLDLTNIESLFGAVEMAKIIGRLADYTPEDIEGVREALIKLIVNTLQKKIIFPVEGKIMVPSQTYQDFVELIGDKGLGQASIITFNYDIALDFALYRADKDVDYCLNHSNNGTKLIKLHGSMNWGRCKECDHIIPYYLNNYINDHRWDLYDKKFVLLDISHKLSMLSKYHNHNGQADYDAIPVIVPPTWNKTTYHSNLSNVWNKAAKELSEARNIYVFGYSLPESDSFFRYLFALGTMGDSRLRRFWVFDPDETGAIKERYKQLLGRGIYDRYEYIPKKFSDGISELQQRINL
jgi:hypothetical protein